MQRIYGRVLDRDTGKAVANASVYIYDAGTSNLSVIYDPSGGIDPSASIANPLTTDANGFYLCAVKNGAYKIEERPAQGANRIWDWNFYQDTAYTGSSAANPTALAGLTPVNGVAPTYLRSDGAPAINQAIAPTWTAVHTYQVGIRTSKIYPVLDSTTAIQLLKADGVTSILNVDTINGNVGIGTVTPMFGLQINTQTDLATMQVYNSDPTKFTRLEVRTDKPTAGGTTDAPFIVKYGATLVAYIRQDGGVFGEYVTTTDNATVGITQLNGGFGVSLRDTALIAWSSTVQWWGAKDTGLSRSSAGVVAVGNGTQGNSTGTLVLSKVIASAAIRPGTFTVATLPAGVAGDRATVTDALAPVFGAAVAGSGAVTVPVYYTGAAWFVG